MIIPTPFDDSLLPSGIRSRCAGDINGLTVYFLEAGYEKPDRPCILLLHGFPELAYSWRKIMLPLAEAGYHVIAPDQRGYGRTTGWDNNYDGDVASFRILNLVRDCIALTSTLGYKSIHTVIGHDFGSRVAAWCALTRPDIFKSVVLMSAPFAGSPPIPTNPLTVISAVTKIDGELAKLEHPRKHYQAYYSTRVANHNMLNCKQGMHDFLRAYFHHKSADWKENQPYPLKGWTASELVKLPTYYAMEADQGMAETVAKEMPSKEAIAQCHWLPDAELAVFAEEYSRTGFQGGLQWYRCSTEHSLNADLATFTGRTIDVPCRFIAGKSDWGMYQMPGHFESMQMQACSQFNGAYLVEGAGHWVQQEQPEKVISLLLEFFELLD
jgi:pimeloyl-ACP methyl ester carboxylesterase